MKRFLPLLIISLLCISCEGIITQKKSSEEFLEEELKTINWNDVDTYPLFEGCNENDSKELQKKCFETFIHIHINEHLNQEQLISAVPIFDTLKISIQLNANSELSVLGIEGDSLTFSTFPELKQRLSESLNSLPQAAPALKRGVPVNTQFTLPLVIKTE
jgi:hypothetical protein